MSLPAVMQHLQVLEACGLVRSEKVGRVRTATSSPPACAPAEGWLGRQRTDWEVRLDRLGGYLTENDSTEEHIIDRHPWHVHP